MLEVHGRVLAFSPLLQSVERNVGSKSYAISMIIAISQFIKLTNKILWHVSSTAQLLSVRVNFCSSTNWSSL